MDWAYAVAVTVNGVYLACDQYQAGKQFMAVVIVAVVLAVDVWAIMSPRRAPGSRSCG